MERKMALLFRETYLAREIGERRTHEQRNWAK
jgi:hypothetical protein